MKTFAATWSAISAALVISSSLLFAQGAPDIVWSGPGHTGINALVVSPDGQTIATASQVDETIKLWNASDGKLLHTLAGHIGGVFSAAFTPDGTMIATAGEFVFGITLPTSSCGGFLMACFCAILERRSLRLLFLLPSRQMGNGSRPEIRVRS